MASLTVNTTNAEDKAIKVIADNYNLIHGTSLTAVQFAAMEFRSLLDRCLQKADNLRGLSFKEVYDRADSTDKTTMDALKVKYGG